MTPVSFALGISKKKKNTVRANGPRLAIFVHNRNNHRRHRSDRIKPKRSSSQKRLHKLDAELPSCTLEEWWSKTKVPPQPTEGTDGQFVWYVDSVRYIYVYIYIWMPTDEIVPSASNPSSPLKSSETSNACMSFTRIVWINGICRTSSTVRCAIAHIFTSSFSRRMSLCGWYNFFCRSHIGVAIFTLLSHIWLTMIMTLMI